MIGSEALPSANADQGGEGSVDRRRVIGLGELVWDLFPRGAQPRRRLGGAPANVAYHVTALGDQGILASRVGKDRLGEQARRFLHERGVDLGELQEDSERPTGSVEVLIDGEGEAKFVIDPKAAWTALSWTVGWASLFARADAICFGSLLQAFPAGRDVLVGAVQAAPSRALRVLDLNLRTPFDSCEVVEAALSAANVVKMSEPEQARIADDYSIADVPRWLIDERGMSMVAVTRGSRGSVLHTPSAHHEHPGHAHAQGDADADPVGAGDAFTAVLTYLLLRDSPPDRINEAANEYAAHVACRRGAMPGLPASLRARVRAR